jgi:hypothetical protein
LLLPQIGFGIPMGAEWLCILAFLGTLAVAIVLAVRSRQRHRAQGFPIAMPAGPGRFKVSGVKRDTRQDVVWHCDADGPANAQVKAESEGIIVTRIERETEQAG